MEIGTITLNENPKNFFSEVEGLSFSPTAIVPGCQGGIYRPASSHTALRPAIGSESTSISLRSKVNQPKYSYNPTKRDGTGNIDNLGSRPNYIPRDQVSTTIKSAKQYEQPPEKQWNSKVISFDSPMNEKIDYAQPAAF